MGLSSERTLVLEVRFLLTKHSPLNYKVMMFCVLT